MEPPAFNGFKSSSAVASVVRSVSRVAGTTTAVFVAYAFVPGTRSITTLSLVGFVLAIGAFGVLVGFEVRSVLRATHPALRAMEVIAVIFPVFVVIFAITYLRMSQGSALAFSEPLDHISALYFTVVAFATVGFGDIVPKTDTARLVVMTQIILDLVFIGLVARVLLGAVKQRIRNPRTLGE